MSRIHPPNIVVILWVAFFVFDTLIVHYSKEWETKVKYDYDFYDVTTNDDEIPIETEENIEHNKDNESDDRVPSTVTEKIFHFCEKSQVFVDRDENSDSNSHLLSLQYQCSGDAYEEFAELLHEFVDITSVGENDISFPWKRREDDDCSAFVPHSSLMSQQPHHYLWGKRDFPLLDNVTVLAVGNSHLRQVSKTMACQYAHHLTNIHFLPAVGELTTNDNHDHSNNDGANVESFALEFSNGARWISITNQVLFYSEEWEELVEEFFLSQLPPSMHSSHESEIGGNISMKDMNAIVLGKFSTYEESKGTNFERTMKDEEVAYYNFRERHHETEREESTRHRRTMTKEVTKKEGGRTRNMKSMDRNETFHQTHTIDAPFDGNNTNNINATRIVSFATIAPPDIVDIARIYDGPVISLSMFSKRDKERVLSSYNIYRDECLVLDRQYQVGDQPMIRKAAVDNAMIRKNINTNLYLIDSRRYIEEMSIECASDDKRTMGTCQEPPQIPEEISTEERYRDPSDMHRCAGAKGGHADLVSWDVIEALYSVTTTSK